MTIVDVQTLLFASVAARFGFILIFIIKGFKSEAPVAFRFWALSIIGSSSALLKIYNDPNYPYFTTLDGAAIYTILGFSLSCISAGGQSFFKRAVGIRRFLTTSLIPGIIYGVTRAAGINPILVLLLSIIPMVYYTGTAANVFFSNKRQRYLPSQLLVGFALSAYSIALGLSVLLLMSKILTSTDVSGGRDTGIGLSLVVDQLASVLVYVGLIAMTLEEAQAQIKALATTDPLTGLANRRGIEEQARPVVAACKRSHRPMSVFIGDLDHFKSINDRHGHYAGDAVLREFSRRLSSHSRRDQDVNGRWGGEEFLAIMADMPLCEARLFADSFRRSVADTPFDIGGCQINVTVSIGVAQIDRDNPSLENAISHADKALYKAKQEGRNRVLAI